MTHSVKLLLGFLILLNIGCSTVSRSQTKIKKKARSYYDEGKEHLTWDRFEEAEEAFKKAIDIQPDFSMALQQLAFIYLRTKRYEQAYSTFHKVTEVDENPPYGLQYELAKLCLATQRYNEADAHLEEYLAGAKPSEQQMADIKRLQENINFSREHIHDNRFSLEFEPHPVECANTSQREYFPTLTADNRFLYFTRKVYTGQWPNEDIFVCERKDGQWQSGRKLLEINTYENEAAPTISPDGRTLYLTKCETDEGFGGCDIWYSERKGNVWQPPKNIGSPINTAAKETQPCISSDGKSLYFVSSRKGGQGKLDIWVSHKKDNGNWGEPENLGPEINTPFMEQRPFIHPDNQTLYFSSDGHPGFGNADLFLSRKDNHDQWQTAVNFGHQVNSYENEESLFITLDGTTGYFATDRYNNNFDLYSFPVHPGLQPRQVTYVEGKVFDATTKKGLQGAVKLIDLETGQPVNETVSDEVTGEYLVCLPVGKDYALNVDRKGYLFFSENFSLEEIEPGETFHQNAPLRKIKKGESTELNNVFFKTDSYQLTDRSKVELDILTKFLKQNSSLEIEIQGHTDNTGTESHNETLSKNRAKSVYDYLVKNGIKKERLSYKGYGSSQPVADNDTEEGRAMNRRTEFTVVGM